MTNYTVFPKYKHYGLVIKFSDRAFSWCVNSKSNRKYLCESAYCRQAIEFTVLDTGQVFTSFEEFQVYLRSLGWEDK